MSLKRERDIGRQGRRTVRILLPPANHTFLTNAVEGFGMTRIIRHIRRGTKQCRWLFRSTSPFGVRSFAQRRKRLNSFPDSSNPKSI
jgi:hypothetical protein